MSARYRRADRIDWVIAGDEAVLFDSASGALFELDRWATSIWVSLDGGQSLDEITGAIAATVDASLESVREDVAAFCATLSEQDLVVLMDGVTDGGVRPE